MFGCASFSGTDPAEHSRSLAFLARHAAADEDWAVRGLEGRLELEQFGYAGMDEVGEKSALRSLPPLIKGYLRLGAMFSRDAVIDRSFNTIDVLVLLPVNRISPRYLAYYGINAERHAAA